MARGERVDEKDERINERSRLNNKTVLLERPDVTWFNIQNNAQCALQKWNNIPSRILLGGCLVI